MPPILAFGAFFILCLFEKHHIFRIFCGKIETSPFFHRDLFCFKNKEISKIEAVAFETAMKAKGGIGQNLQGIMLESIPGTDFSGIRLLSYYYVSWALFKPDFVGELGLPFEKEYAAANSQSNP
ncbi:hypothetical protein [Aquiflexum sp.]|uniref:hypothetical protein n=1 Tax=Aquiflexum sp. TaxID=1872584 RepID=UPI00359319E4